MIKLITSDITTDGAGDFTESLQNMGGLIRQVRYVVDGVSPLAAGADLTIVENTTGLNVLTMANIGVSSFTRSPRELAANAADGVVGTNSALIATQGDLTLTIAQGGATKDGTVYIWIEV